MTITTTTRGPIQIAHLAGELDDEGAELLEQSLGERIERGGRIVVDLTNLGHINSCGLGALVNATARANVQECRIVLAGPSPQVAGVLEITRLTQFFEIAPSLDEALARLGS